MGVERAVTRWYALRQTIQREIDALQARLEQLQSREQPAQERAAAEQQLALAQARLLALGPCPKSMMG
ncbi:MAG TPA: hypothetical protein VF458_14140 [Ktedonobacteraceae bacterium]